MVEVKAEEPGREGGKGQRGREEGREGDGHGGREERREGGREGGRVGGSTRARQSKRAREQKRRQKCQIMMFLIVPHSTYAGVTSRKYRYTSSHITYICHISMNHITHINESYCKYE